jgi:hypothetical protein
MTINNKLTTVKPKLKTQKQSTNNQNLPKTPIFIAGGTF